MNALVTLGIGDQCLSRWRQFCERGWRDYAQRHRLDLVVFTEWIKPDSRSPSWQKCLTLDTLWQYEQIAILDSDIAINVNSPNVFEGVPVGRIGGVLSGGHIHDDLRALLLRRLAELNG